MSLTLEGIRADDLQAIADLRNERRGDLRSAHLTHPATQGSWNPTWACAVYEDGAWIGYVQLCGVDWVHRSAEVAVLCRSQEAEALRLLAGWAFQSVGLHRLVGETLTPSRALLMRLAGFVSEGVSREAYFVDGSWVDAERWSLLASQWTSRSASAPSQPSTGTLPTT